MIIRAKRKTLFQGKPLTEKQQSNSDLNLREIENGATILESKPRRIVLELTNLCNLNCIMCGRNSADFKTTILNMEWFYKLESIFDTIEEVTLMGWGEPTMHPNFIEMLKTIDKYNTRKYFCTNGMSLDKIKEAIFKYKVDVFAVSVDGATQETNSRIRRGSDLNKIMENLREITEYKKTNKLKYPWINFVFCAMKSNIHELPDLVRLAAEVGIEEVKVVYLTAFDNNLADEVLWNCSDITRKYFDEAEKIGDKLGIVVKFPYIQGEDIAGNNEHNDCFVTWRDFFLGSDGFIRPCMSTPVQFMKFDMNKTFEEMWNSEQYQKYRKTVNDPELMDSPCRRCYQSSHCNWNKKITFLQMEQQFSPEWKKEGM